MNTQNISQEQWIIWKPIENLPNKCWLNMVNETPSQQLIILLSDKKETCTVSLEFNNNVTMYKVSEETCTINLLYDVIGKYGDDFMHGSTFFKILNSSYVEWLVQQSNGLLNAENLNHYCIFGIDSVIDIITSQEPKVTITYNAPELSKD